MKKQNVILLSIILAALTSIQLFSQTWQKVNGPNAFVNKIFILKDEPAKIIVSSDQVPTDVLKESIEFPPFNIGRLGYIVSNDSGKTFGSPFLNDYSVYDLVQLPFAKNIWAASARNFNSGVILLSFDNGVTWDSTTFHCEETSQIFSIMPIASKAPLILCGTWNTPNGVRSTIDTFATCSESSSLKVQARNFIASPLDPSLIFMAGDKSDKHVYRSYDYGKTWLEDVSGLEGLRILSLMPSSISKAIVIAGCDYFDSQTQESQGRGIYFSGDTGKTWKLTGANGMRVFQIAQHPLYPRYLAAACDSFGVMLSGTYGAGWEKFSSGFPDSSSVRTIAIPAWDSTKDGIIVFAGVFNNVLNMPGLYKSSRIKTGVEDELNNTGKAELLSIYPMPFDKEVTVKWYNPESNPVRFRIRDLFGRIVFETQPQYYPDGVNSFIWNPESETGNGIFFIELQTKGQTLVGKIVLSR